MRDAQVIRKIIQKIRWNKICPGRKNAENVGINSKAEVCLIYMNVFP